MVFVAIRSVSSTFSKMGSQESLGKYASKAVVDTTKSSVISLIPHDFALEYPRPLTPNVKMIGPVLPEVAGKLPDDLETFMTDSKQVVVVSFGTTLSNYRPDFIEMLADALGKLPFYVLWRQIGHLPEKISPNIKIVTWFPQNDLLGHPSTKVFLTHGGLNSFLESMYHAVPMVVLPLFGDQHKQASLVKIKELGVSLDKNVIKSEDITRSITEVANNMKYKDNAQRISRLLRDRRQSPAEEGAYWIEYALKHQGAQHLMSSAYDMQLCQFYMFDVFLFVLVVIVVLVCMFLGLCYFMICQRKSKIPEKEKKT
jgi:UDP:flavonoid glycosyltransferase YjiC (YdhE family)